MGEQSKKNIVTPVKIVVESSENGLDTKIIKKLFKTRVELLSYRFNEHFSFAYSDDSHSIGDVLKMLKRGMKTSEFTSPMLKRLLIIVDTDENLRSRLDEILSAFRSRDADSLPKFNLPAGLNEYNEIQDGEVAVSIFLLPNCRDIGSLENLCYEGFQGESEEILLKKQAVNTYIDTLRSHNIEVHGMTENNISKSKFRVYRSTPNPDGYTHHIEDWVNLGSNTFNALVDFLRVNLSFIELTVEGETQQP